MSSIPILAVPETLQSHILQLVESEHKRIRQEKKEKKRLKKEFIQQELQKAKNLDKERKKFNFEKFVGYVNILLQKMATAVYGDTIKVLMDFTKSELDEISYCANYYKLQQELSAKKFKLNYIHLFDFKMVPYIMYHISVDNVGNSILIKFENV